MEPEEEVYSLKILVHNILINSIIFNSDYNSVQTPLLAIKFLNYPYLTIPGKSEIRSDEGRQAEESVRERVSLYY